MEFGKDGVAAKKIQNKRGGLMRWPSNIRSGIAWRYRLGRATSCGKAKDSGKKVGFQHFRGWAVGNQPPCLHHTQSATDISEDDAR